MKTVIQKIGPLYGEPVNGSVFGQPNGSEAIPSENKVYAITTYSAIAYIKNSGAQVITCSSTGTVGIFANMATNIQFTQAYTIKMEVSDSNTFGNILTYIQSNAPIGSTKFNVQVVGTTNDLTVVAGTKYYLRVSVLLDGNVVCVSDTYEMEGYA